MLLENICNAQLVICSSQFGFIFSHYKICSKKYHIFQYHFLISSCILQWLCAIPSLLSTKGWGFLYLLSRTWHQKNLFFMLSPWSSIQPLPHFWLRQTGLPRKQSSMFLIWMERLLLGDIWLIFSQLLSVSLAHHPGGGDMGWDFDTYIPVNPAYFRWSKGHKENQNQEVCILLGFA